MPPSRALTSVVIVTYNSVDDIEACLTPLSGDPTIEVVVVDNDSTDGTPQLLEKLMAIGAIDRIILSPTNDGFARAVNRGIRASSGRDVLLLNPDAAIASRDVSLLRSAVDEDEARGIVAPMVDSGSHVKTLPAGAQPLLWPMFAHFSGLARLFPRLGFLRGRYLYREPHSRENQIIGWASGCCLYISRRALDRVGLLSERWFMYGEDVEYCHRVIMAGLRVELLAGVRATHLIGASVNRSGGSVSGMWPRNTYDYYVSEFRPGPVRRLAWRSIFSVGMFSRAAALSAVALIRTGPRRAALRDRARRFRGFSAAVWTRDRSAAQARPVDASS